MDAKQKEELSQFRHAIPEHINELFKQYHQVKLATDIAVPEGYRITMVAEGLTFPTGVAFDPILAAGGDVLAAARMRHRHHVRDDGIVFLARTPKDPGEGPKLDVVDMSTPATPGLLSRWVPGCTGNIYDIDMEGSELYIAAYWSGLWIVNAKDLTDLRLSERYDWQDMWPYALSVRAFQGFALVSQVVDAPPADPSMQAFDVFKDWR